MAASCLEGVHEVQEKERAVLSRLLSSSRLRPAPGAPGPRRQGPAARGRWGRRDVPGRACGVPPDELLAVSARSDEAAPFRTAANATADDALHALGK